MVRNRVFCILIILFSLYSCSSPKKAEIPVVKTAGLSLPPDKLLPINILKENKAEGIALSPLMIEPEVYKDGLEGVRLSFDIEVSQSGVDKLKTDPLTSYYYNVAFGTQQESLVPDISDLQEVKFSNLNAPPLVNTAGKRTISLHLPYNKMETAVDVAELFVHLRVFHARFKKERNMKEVKILDKLNKEEEAGVLGNIKIKLPAIKSIALQVDGFALDSEKVTLKRFDLGITGNGYPDLFWKVDVAGKNIFSSPVKKNTSRYLSSFVSPYFRATMKDSIKIIFADSDNEKVMNKTDPISIWEGSVESACKEFANPTGLKLKKLSQNKITILFKE